MNDIVIAILGSSVVSTLLNYFIGKLDKKDNVKNSLMVLMGWDIRKGCKDALKANKISFNELKQLEEMNKTYKAMGGNGFVKTLMEKVERLEIVED